jgi:hypothetical protein
MGLFSSKKTITVSARTLNLLEAPKNIFLETILNSVVTGERLSTSILSFLHNSIVINVPRIYEYARDHYTLGLPQGTSLNYNNADLDRIDEILAIEIGSSPPLKTMGATYMDITPVISVYPHLYITRQYNRFTNLIGNPPAGIVWQQEPGSGSLNVTTANKEVRLQSASVALDGVSIDVVYGLFLERPVVIPGDEFYEATIEIQFVEESYTYTENVPLAGIASITWGEEYLVAFYREYDQAGVVPISTDRPWLYQVSSNVHPELAPIDNTPATVDYFPVIPLRYYNKDLMSEDYFETPLYITSKKLAKYANLDLDLLAEKLNKNPSIGDIDHAYVMYGVNVRTEVKESLLYLHGFFEQMYEAQYSNELEYLDKVGTVPYYGLDPINSLVSGSLAGSSFEEHGLKIYLDYDYVTSTIAAGQVGDGKVGNIEKEFIEYGHDVITNYDAGEGGIIEVINHIHKGAITLRLQTATDVVHTISVYGLEHRNLIYKNRSEYTSMLDVIRDPDENNLVIPIQFNLAQSMKFTVRMNLYADAMLMIINTYQVIKGKWYTADWFKVIMIIIAVVLTVVALMSGQAWAVTLIEAGYSTLAAYGIVIAVNIMISIAVSIAAKYLIKTFGPKLGIFATAVLMVVAIIATGGAYSGEAVNQFLLMTAQYCLQAGAALIAASNDFLIEKGQDVVNEYKDFSAKLEDRYKELKTAQDLLDEPDFNPLMFVQPPRLKIVPNESPDQFYTRCLELPAYTMFTIHEQIENFCDTHLKLPKTMPKTNYA